ncbi:MAG TPA: MBL fold metallo-hydrolase [Bacteroidales bacterium]|nr:MBL fold metallo-hydrolase [Bacteroidales bacterium]
MKVDFYSLSSGSSGNCYYVGNGFHGILIDAGISATSVRKFLKNIDVSMQSIMGILVTHNHIDHIKGLGQLAKRNYIPVFSTKKVWESILASGVNVSPDCIRKIPLQKGFSLAGFGITAFPVHHDAPETIGFQILAGDKKITIVTDLGHICDTAARYIQPANLLVLESNYDEEMLATGKYPYFLKARIRGNNGHLGNHQAAGFLADIINDDLQYILLAHLSRNNNTPEKAVQSLHDTFSERGIKLNANQKVVVLNRNSPTEMISMITEDQSW